MAGCCLLSDLPGAALGEVLRRLAGADVAALRLVSRAACARATDAAPAIECRVAPGAGAAMRAWSRATQRLRHVPAVRVRISGALAAEDFSSLAAALASRGVAELHLLPAGSGHADGRDGAAAAVPSLHPLRVLLAGLHTLVVEGVSVGGGGLGPQLAALLAGAGSADRLRRVQLGGPCCPTALAGALQALARAAPGLRALALRLPGGWAGAPAAVSAPHEEQLAALRAGGLAMMALAQLQQLEELALSGLPDGMYVPAAAAAAAGLRRRELKTLDSCGCWLLAALPRLAALRLEAGAWALAWQCGGSSTPRGAASAGAGLPLPSSMSASHRARGAGAGRTGRSGRKAASPPALQAVLSELAAATSSLRPAALLGSSLTSLQLALLPEQLSGAADALRAMPRLAELKLTLLATSARRNPRACFSGLVAASAAATGLRSLSLTPGLGDVRLQPGALLPLTASAGGPGQRLKQLRLVGCFSGGGNGSGVHTDAAAAEPWAGLEQLAGLQQLRLRQLKPTPLQLPVAALPASLTLLEARRVHLAGPGASTSTSGSGSGPALHALHLHECWLDAPASLASASLTHLTVAGSDWAGGWRAAAAAWPAVRSLAVSCIGRSRLSGCGSSGCSSGAAGEAQVPNTAAAVAAASDAAVGLVLVQQLAGFARCEQLRLQHLPCLSAGVLAAAVSMPQLKQLQICAAGAAGLAPALPCELPARCSLRRVSLRVPGSLPAPIVAQLRQAGIGLAPGVEAGGGSTAEAAAALQASLRTALPWATVEVSAAGAPGLLGGGMLC